MWVAGRVMFVHAMCDARHAQQRAHHIRHAAAAWLALSCLPVYWTCGSRLYMSLAFLVSAYHHTCPFLDGMPFAGTGRTLTRLVEVSLLVPTGSVFEKNNMYL